MYYVIKGYSSLKQKLIAYADVAYNKREKNILIKQYKGYLQNKEIDSFKVVSYLDNGKIKDIIAYQ